MAKDERRTAEVGLNWQLIKEAAQRVENYPASIKEEWMIMNSYNGKVSESSENKCDDGKSKLRLD